MLRLLTSDDSVRNNGSLGKHTDTSLRQSIQGRNRFYQCYCYNSAAELVVVVAVVVVAAACLGDWGECDFDCSHQRPLDCPNLLVINNTNQGRTISIVKCKLTLN